MSTTVAPSSADSIRRLLSGAGELPVLPELATRILRELRAPRVTTARLAALVRRDPVLASSLLRVANSALYGARVEITDLAFAMTRVGLGQTRNLVLANVLRSRLADGQVYGPAGPALMNHALAVASGSQMLAEAADEPPDEAFLCGLLHDVGRLALLKVLRESQGVEGGGLPEDVAALADGFHTEAGEQLASAWGLPGVVGTVARYHHEVDEAPSPRRSMVALVSLADSIAHALGVGEKARAGMELSALPARRHLALGEDEIDEVIAQLPRVFETARVSIGCSAD